MVDNHPLKRDIRLIDNQPRVKLLRGCTASSSSLFPSLELAWYVDSFLSSRQEVHAVELGVFSGVILLELSYFGCDRTGAAVTIGLLLFGLGVPQQFGDLQANCTGCGSKVIQAKPWYFLSGPEFAGLLGFSHRVFRTPRSRTSGDEERQ